MISKRWCGFRYSGFCSRFGSAPPNATSGSAHSRKRRKIELPTIAREVDVVRRFARASWRAGHRSATDAARVCVGSRDAIARDHPAMRRALAREVRWIAFLLSVWRLFVARYKFTRLLLGKEALLRG